MGTNTHEFALFMAMVPLVIPGFGLPASGSSVRAAVEHLVAYHPHWNASTTVPQILEQGYPEHRYRHSAYRMVALGTDFCFRCPTRSAVRRLTKRGVETYLYNFDFRGHTYLDPDSEACELDSEVLCGVPHAAELRYVFDSWLVGLTKDAARMSEVIGTYWTNFAKFGTPNGHGAKSGDGAGDADGKNASAAGGGSGGAVVWPAYTAAGDEHLHLAKTVAVGTGFGKRNCDFFDGLPPA